MKSIFSNKKSEYFTAEEREKIVAAIKEAETRTSGEIRVHIENHCRFVDPLLRAAEVFINLKMEATVLRNGVLIYVALKDRQLAIYADEGIYQKAGSEFWKNEVEIMLSEFRQYHYAQGLIEVILQIGEVLSQHFPYDEKIDKNELPDEIAFGE